MISAARALAPGFERVRGDPAERLARRVRMTALLIGALAVSLLLIGLFARIGGAVIGVGQVAVQSRVKTIIHPSGGVLSALYVRDGDRVSPGQILMRFDTSVAAIDASRSGMGLNELLARRARLEAERDNQTAISFAPELTGSADESVAALIGRESRQFALNLNGRSSTLALLRERVAQGEAQVRNLEAQVTANRRQSALIEPELAGLRSLYERKLVTVGRLNQLERAAVEIEGNRAALQASIAQVRAQIAETREQMLGVEVNARAGAAAELAQVNAQTNEQVVRRASAVSTFERSAVRAPQAGVIDKLAYTTIGSAIPPGQPILQIVPDAGELVIEGRVNPRDIDQIRIGQSARVSFPSLNRQTTPDVTGKVVFVSAQPGQDALTGRPYFRVHVSFDRRRLAHAIAAPLVDGMPAEIFFETSRRSVWSYLFKPLFDQLAHAMRED